MILGNVVTFAIAALVATPGALAAAGDSNPPFTITISSTQGAVEAGEEIRVRVVLTNVSNQELPVRLSRNPLEAEMHYTVSVHEESGKDAAETKYGSAAKKHQLFTLSEAETLLKPGERLEEHVVLTKLFDLSSPREYVVQLSRPASADPKDGVIKSNVITITVVSKPEGHMPK